MEILTQTWRILGNDLKLISSQKQCLFLYLRHSFSVHQCVLSGKEAHIISKSAWLPFERASFRDYSRGGGGLLFKIDCFSRLSPLCLFSRFYGTSIKNWRERVRLRISPQTRILTLALEIPRLLSKQALYQINSHAACMCRFFQICRKFKNKLRWLKSSTYSDISVYEIIFQSVLCRKFYLFYAFPYKWVTKFQFLNVKYKFELSFLKRRSIGGFSTQAHARSTRWQCLDLPAFSSILEG